MVSNLTVKVGANIQELQKELQKATNQLGGFGKQINSIGKKIGKAFAIQQMAAFTLQVSRLAGEAEAVRSAFERLPNSTKLMNELKQATGGTVSELDLMKRAVQASNFEISLSALPRLLEFATLRAQQTGQSVDYLVDSIVTGIGRKSKLILDNLGISAVQLNEALGDTAIGAASIGDVADAVGRIIDKNLENMNGFMDNNATKLQRLTASWENYKVAVGEAANETGLLGNTIDGISATLDLLSNRDLTFFETLRAFLSGPGGAGTAAAEAIQRNFEKTQKEARQLAFVTRQVDEAFVKFKGNIDEFAKAISPDHPLRGKFLEEFKKRLIDANKVEVETLESLRNKQKLLIEQFDKETSVNNTKELQQIGAKIIAYQKQIDKLEALKRAEKEKKGLKMTFTPDLEAEGSLNPELRNDQARNEALAFSESLMAVATSAEFAGGAVVQLQQATGEVVQKMGEMVDFTPVVHNALSGIGYALGSAINGSSSFGEALLGVIGGVLTQLGEMLIAAGLGVEAFKKSLESINGVAAIGAGIALIAMGSAISGSIKELGSSAGKSHKSAGSSRGGGGMSRGSLNGNGLEIAVGGEFRIQGRDLVYIFNREQQLNSRTRG